MENLEKALLSLSKEDLIEVKEAPKSTLIEPTEDEIKSIICALKSGLSLKEIKKTIRRFELDEDGNQLSAKGFSDEQIKEIDEARLKKVSDLDLVELEKIEI